MLEYWVFIEPCMLNPTARDFGVSTWLERVGRKVTGVSIISGTDFMCLHRKYKAAERLQSVSGRYSLFHHWSHQDLRKIIKEFHKIGVKVVIMHFGVWSHGASQPGTYRFLERHPELLMTSDKGEFPVGIEFNPLKDLKEDRELGISEGIPFVEYYGFKVKQTIDDFGFDGLILADGFQGFRCEPGASTIPGSEKSLLFGIERVDFSDNYIDLFSRSYHLKVPEGPTQKRSEYILKNCFKEWADFSRQSWEGWFTLLSKRLQGCLFGTVDAYGYSPDYAYSKAGFDYWTLKGKVDYFIVQSAEYAKSIGAGYGYPFTRDVFAKTIKEAYKKLPGTKVCAMDAVRDPNEGWNGIVHRPDIIKGEILTYLSLKVKGKRIVKGLFNPCDGDMSAEEYAFIDQIISSAGL